MINQFNMIYSHWLSSPPHSVDLGDGPRPSRSLQSNDQVSPEEKWKVHAGSGREGSEPA